MHKFYGQFDPPVDRFIFERYFPDTNIKGVFVECGAFDGLLECSCKFFEETMGWSGFNLEPAPSNYDVLVTNRPFSRNIKLGLSSQSGCVAFKHAISPILGKNFGNGSIEHTSAHVQSLEERGCSFEELQIEVATWKTFVEQEKISRVDLFVLDVEGHELSVIEGMHGCAVLPDLICIEVGHLDLDIIRVQLARLNYVYDISSHVNAFFVKQEKFPLFALRAASRVNASVDTLPSVTYEECGRSAQDSTDIQMEALKQENAHMKRHINDVTQLYREVISSKA